MIKLILIKSNLYHYLFIIILVIIIMYFTIIDNYINIKASILGGSSNNLKIINLPKVGNTLTFLDRSSLKVKDINWQLKIEDKWKNLCKGNDCEIENDHVNKQLRVMITYFDNDGFLDYKYISYFNVSDSNTFTLPEANENKDYYFSFVMKDYDEIMLTSNWLDYNINNDIIELNGIPTNTAPVIFHIKKESEIISFILYINGKKNVANTLKNIVINRGATELVTDNLYIYKIKTISSNEQVYFEVENLPSWLNLINNNDGSALISGIPNINNVGDNKILINVFYKSSFDIIDYTIKVLQDNTLPILTELKSIPDVTNSKNIYYYFKSSKKGNIIYEGNIKSNKKTAEIGVNKMLLKTRLDGIYSGAIKIKDANKNISKPLIIKSFKVDRIKPQLDYVHIESGGKNPNFATFNDIIKIKLKANKEILKPTVVIANRYINVEKISKTEYEAFYKVSKAAISSEVKFNINYVDYLKVKGKEVTEVTDSSFVKIDTSKPKLRIVKVYSSNSNKLFGKIDDIINVEVIADKPINTPNIEIFGEDTNIIKVNEFCVVGRYLIKESTDKSNDFLKIEYEDLAGNKGDIVTKTTDNSVIDINTDKIKLVELSTINFTINSNVEYRFESDSNGVIDGYSGVKSNTMNVVEGENVIIFDNLENGIYNNAKIFVKNDVDNVTELLISEFVVNSNEINPEFDLVSLETDGINTDLKANDIVILFFKTNKIINHPIVEFKSGENDITNNVIIKKKSDLEWTAEYIVHENDSFGAITFNIEIFDKFNLNKSTNDTTDNSFLLFNKENINFIQQEIDSINNRISNIRNSVIDCFFKTEILNNRLDTVKEFETIKNINDIIGSNKVISLVGDEVSVYINNDSNITDVNYQWQRKKLNDEIWQDINGETSSSYKIVSDDMDYNLRTKVSFTKNGEGNVSYPNDIYVLNPNNKIWNFLQA